MWSEAGSPYYYHGNLYANMSAEAQTNAVERVLLSVPIAGAFLVREGSKGLPFIAIEAAIATADGVGAVVKYRAKLDDDKKGVTVWIGDRKLHFASFASLLYAERVRFRIGVSFEAAQKVLGGKGKGGMGGGGEG